MIQNMNFSHAQQCKAIQLAMEDQLEIMEANIEYSNPLEIELNSKKDKEVHREIMHESMDESVIYFEEVNEFEFENVEYLYDSCPHPPPLNQSL